MNHVHSRKVRPCQSRSTRRRLLFEQLEVRLAPALLAPGADAVAEARFFANVDGPNQVSDPVNAEASAAIGPMLADGETAFQHYRRRGEGAKSTIISKK